LSQDIAETLETKLCWKSINKSAQRYYSNNTMPKHHLVVKLNTTWI